MPSTRNNLALLLPAVLFLCCLSLAGMSDTLSTFVEAHPGENAKYVPKDPDQIKVIGAGFGRTGTEAMTKALDILQLGPSFHMLENFKHPWLIPRWRSIELDLPNRKAHLEGVLRGYHATMDFPVSLYYKELKEMYPKAKVVLTVRDSPEAWWKSAEETISRFCNPPFADLPGVWLYMNLFPMGMLSRFAMESVCKKVFPQSLHSKEVAIKAYLANIEEVKRTIPKEDLLIFNNKEGWGPLCKFLGVPVPSVPFPHTNTKDHMQMGPLLVTTLMGYATPVMYLLILRRLWRKIMGRSTVAGAKVKSQ